MKKIFPLLLILLYSCTSGDSENQIDSSDLTAIFEAYDNFQQKEFPSVSDSIYDHLSSMKEEDVQRRAEYYKELMDQLAGLEDAGLSDEEEVSRQLLYFILNDKYESYQFKAHLNPLLVDWGFHISFAFTPSQYEFQNPEDYRNYEKLMLDFPRYIDEQIALMRKGLEAGVSQSRIIFQGYEITFDRHIVETAEESLFFGPYKNFPATMKESDREELIASGKSAIMQGAVEGYRRFSKFMKEEYMPNTRESLGALNLPEGEAYYQQRIKYFTTLDLSADSIHNLGLSEVARIRAEMDEIIEELNFKGDFADFLNFLRTDPQFFAKTPEELLMRASYISKKMDGKLPALFGKLPRQPYTVNPVPDHLAPKYTTGRYVSAPIESTKPGQYWVNTYDLPVRTLYTLEALTLHEAVPGHHLQSALTSELDLPRFRTNLYLSAYGEGWGLYSEFLGIEAGFYQDPYSDFGRLTYEMWRACRLVVDTGIHAKGWSREQVMDYMAANTALSLYEIQTETDRYISWPAQALSYKIGEIKIRQLRKRTEEALGEDFDVREFHDLIMSQGPVTLEILESMVEDFIQQNS